jgi:hypothetical protein
VSSLVIGIKGETIFNKSEVVHFRLLAGSEKLISSLFFRVQVTVERIDRQG